MMTAITADYPLSKPIDNQHTTQAKNGRHLETKMNRQDAITAAAELAYEEDAIMVIGKVQGKYAIAHNEDVGRIAEMTDTEEVDATGVIEE
jgi:hypothetical protein